MRSGGAQPAPRDPDAGRVRVDLDGIDNLPALPEVVTRILTLVDDPNISAERIAEVAGQDQSMVAGILRMVNSPFYGLARRITSIQHAVVLLGFRAVRNLALSAVLVRTFGSSSRDRRFDRTRLWRHTVACGTGARLLAREVGTVDPEEAFLAGLVHEIGLLVFDQFYHGGLGRVLDLVLTEGCGQREAEVEVFGHDHAEVGRALARRWNFPPGVVEAIGCHHDPTAAKREPALAAVVHLSDHFHDGRPPVAADPDRTEGAAGPEAAEAGACPGRPTAAPGGAGPASPEAPADAPGPSRPSLALVESPPADLWRTDDLDARALDVGGVTGEMLARVERRFEEEWRKAQAFLSLLA